MKRSTMKLPQVYFVDDLLKFFLPEAGRSCEIKPRNLIMDQNGHRKIALIFLLSFFVTIALGQTIEQLEYDLSWHKGSEEYGDKISAAKKLQALDPFNAKAVEYICRYYSDRKIDSVSIFFNELIGKFPKSTKPLLLRADLLFLEYDYQQRDTYTNQQRNILAAAHDIDSLDQDVIYQLAKMYYRDFLYPLEKMKWGFGIQEDSLESMINQPENQNKHSVFDYAADSALLYFGMLWRQNKNLRAVIYYPARQLECYLNTSYPGSFSENDMDSEQCFFPAEYFCNLGDNWACDFTVDYLFNTEFARDIANRIKTQLLDLRERCINDKKSSPAIYRFTWLRTFDAPISIRIENSKSDVTLFWKVGKGAGGYAPRGLKKSGRKHLNNDVWKEFTALVEEADFDNSPNLMYYPMNDGATWTLERRTDGRFKAVHTNVPPQKFKTSCLYLLRKTNLRIKDSDIY